MFANDLFVDKNTPYIFCSLFIIIFSVFFDLWILPFFCLLFFFQFSKVNYLRYAFVVFFLSFLLFLNLSKEITGDYIWYSEHYIAMSTGYFKELFFVPYYGVVAKISEPLYHLYSLLLAQLTGGNIAVHKVATTLFIYAVYLISVYYLTILFDINKYYLPLVFFIAVTLCVSFTLSNHLIRQLMASSLFMLATVKYLQRKKCQFIALSSLSLLTHNSMLLPLVILYYSFQVFHRRIYSKYLIGFGVLSLGLFTPLLIRYLSGKHPEIYTQNDGSVSFLVVIYDLCLLTFSVATLWKQRFTKFEGYDFFCVLVGFYFFYMIFLGSLYQSPLLQLRFYFFVEFLRIIPFLLFIRLFISGKNYFLYSALFSVFGFLYLQIRILQSPFNYNGDVVSYLLTGFYGR